MSNIAYAFGVSLFFWGYLLFQAPLSLVIARTGARRGIWILAIAWGLISFAMMFMQSANAFYVLRFLLGVSEAAFFPATLLFLTQWFPAHRQVKIMSFLFLATPLGVILGGPAIGWVMENMNGVVGLSGWRWALLMNAAPSLIAALLVRFVLTDGPREAAWLTQAEQDYLSAELTQSDAEKSGDLRAALRSPLVWFLALICFLYNIGHYGLLFWTPTIIQGFGLASTFHVGLLTAIPYAAAMATMLIIAARSERRGERRLHSALPILVAGIALPMSVLVAENLPLSLMFLTIAVAGLMTTLVIFWSIPGSILSGSAAVGCAALINSAAVVAAMIGSTLVGVLKEITGGTEPGIISLGGILLLAGFLILRLPATVMNRGPNAQKT